MHIQSKIRVATVSLSIVVLLTACDQPAPTYSPTAVAQNQEYVERAAKMATESAAQNTKLPVAVLSGQKGNVTLSITPTPKPAS